MGRLVAVRDPGRLGRRAVARPRRGPRRSVSVRPTKSTSRPPARGGSPPAGDPPGAAPRCRAARTPRSRSTPPPPATCRCRASASPRRPGACRSAGPCSTVPVVDHRPPRHHPRPRVADEGERPVVGHLRLRAQDPGVRRVPAERRRHARRLAPRVGAAALERDPHRHPARLGHVHEERAPGVGDQHGREASPRTGGRRDRPPARAGGRVGDDRARDDVPRARARPRLRAPRPAEDRQHGPRAHAGAVRHRGGRLAAGTEAPAGPRLRAHPGARARRAGAPARVLRAGHDVP